LFFRGFHWRSQSHIKFEMFTNDWELGLEMRRQLYLRSKTRTQEERGVNRATGRVKRGVLFTIEEMYAGSSFTLAFSYATPKVPGKSCPFPGQNSFFAMCCKYLCCSGSSTEAAVHTSRQVGRAPCCKTAWQRNQLLPTRAFARSLARGRRRRRRR